MQPHALLSFSFFVGYPEPLVYLCSSGSATFSAEYTSGVPCIKSKEEQPEQPSEAENRPTEASSEISKKKRTLSEEETSNLENHNFNYVHHFFGEGLGWVYFEGYVFPGSCWSSKPILVSFWAREYRKFHYFQTVAYLEQKSTEKLDIVCASLSEQFRISKTMLPDLVCTYVCIYIYTLINMYIINSYNKCIT